jgi:hypothetical protein
MQHNRYRSATLLNTEHRNRDAEQPQPLHQALKR